MFQYGNLRRRPSRKARTMLALFPAGQGIRLVVRGARYPLTGFHAKCRLTQSLCTTGRFWPLRNRSLRVLVFLLAGWPLLLPPGICICQLVRAGRVVVCSLERTSAHDQKNSCPNECCDRRKADSIPGRAGENVLADEQDPPCNECPPSCAVCRALVDLTLVESQLLASACIVALTPMPFCNDPSFGPRLHVPPLTSEASDRPIYLALCALLI